RPPKRRLDTGVRQGRGPFAASAGAWRWRGGVMKAAWLGFRSRLAAHIEGYLATKRALGCRFHSEDRTLRLFDRFLVDACITTIDGITADTVDRFLASRPRRAPKSHNHLL